MSEITTRDYDMNDVGHGEDLLQLVTFHIDEEEFGVDILDVHEIIRLMQITPVPNAVHYIEGVVNLRGKVIPVIGLRKRFEFEDIELTSETRIIVMELDQKVMGFLVDGVSEVLVLPVSQVEVPPPVVAGIGSEYIRGIGKLEERLLILLDLDALLSQSDLQNLP